MRAAALELMLAVALVGCRGGEGQPASESVAASALASAASPAPAPAPASAFASAFASATASATASAFASRPYGLHIPSYGGDGPRPLVVLLHGYGSSGAMHVRLLDLDAFADAHGFVLAYPDGTVDSRGRRFWNATDACCDFDHTGVDDVGYIRWLLDDVAAKTSIDPERVYVFGHSNGGFFVHRLACDLAPRIAAAVSLAGDGWRDATRCRPSEPVSVLEIHGDADDVIRLGGGRVFDLPVPAYPSVRATMAAWAAKDGCTGALAASGRRLDFDQLVPGAETTELATRGCPAGIGVELWTVAGGSHVPHPSASALEAIWAWMAAHPKHARPTVAR